MTSTAFMTGTWYSVDFPDDKNYDLEDLYDKYWMGGLPDDVEISESEVSHIWQDDLKAISEARTAVKDALEAIEEGCDSADLDYAVARLKSALEGLSKAEQLV